VLLFDGVPPLPLFTGYDLLAKPVFAYVDFDAMSLLAVCCLAESSVGYR